jgi:ATP-dependent 26S proteasome regulatory subunit
MKKKSPRRKSVETMLTDPDVPEAMKRELLVQLLGAEEEEAREILSRWLDHANRAASEGQYLEKTKELNELIQQMQQAPLRCASFDRMVDAPGLGRRAHVILYDGGAAFCIVPDAGVAARLRRGDTVWLDSNGGALLYHQPEPVTLGEEARLERWLPDGNVEVVQGELGRYICRPSADLVDQRARGEAEAGCSVVASPRRLFAFHALPTEEDAGSLRYLCREPVPDVVLERDVGSPARFITDFARHVEREMTQPDRARLYRLRRSRMVLATGVPGSGKTLSIDALWRRLYEIMSRLIGVPIDALPQRVMRLRATDVLSKWVGGSDKRIDRFFEDLSQLAGTTFRGPDGREWELPVLVVCEEIDALARKRGEDPIHDRIQATLLSGLDPSRRVYKDRLILVVCTTNVPHTLDAAFRRRIAGSVEQFGHLGHFGFRAVMGKLLRDLPFACDGRGEDVVRRQAVAELGTWLFAPHGGDGAVVELSYVGQPAPVLKHRRDFLTAGLLDRAVQQACDQACDADWSGADPSGLTTELLSCAIDDQVRHIVDQLAPGNCEQYLTLPDATRVASVRRVSQPTVLPIQLERAS